ncbi:hypothetical protein [Anatilimnocola floriformis]|uniref:hypothetical protein n=1 Tax=Anatilimnocola floriformis TaxID=2948575 RepID=UPI0020C4A618|nr:hypothetical protein [Anatilimnocola floriformis]
MSPKIIGFFALNGYVRRGFEKFVSFFEQLVDGPLPPPAVGLQPQIGWQDVFVVLAINAPAGPDLEFGDRRELPLQMRLCLGHPLIQLEHQFEIFAIVSRNGWRASQNLETKASRIDRVVAHSACGPQPLLNIGNRNQLERHDKRCQFREELQVSSPATFLGTARQALAKWHGLLRIAYFHASVPAGNDL